MNFREFLEAQAGPNPAKPANLQNGPGKDQDTPGKKPVSPLSPRGGGSPPPKGWKAPGGPGSKNADAPVPTPQAGLSGMGQILKGPLPPGLSGGVNQNQQYAPNLSAGVPVLRGKFGIKRPGAK